MLEDIDFADVIALLSSNANHPQKKTNDLNLNAMKICLKINKKKTKTIFISTTNNTRK